MYTSSYAFFRKTLWLLGSIPKNCVSLRTRITRILTFLVVVLQNVALPQLVQDCLDFVDVLIDLALRLYEHLIHLLLHFVEQVPQAVGGLDNLQLKRNQNLIHLLIVRLQLFDLHLDLRDKVGEVPSLVQVVCMLPHEAVGADGSLLLTPAVGADGRELLRWVVHTDALGVRPRVDQTRALLALWNEPGSHVAL